MLRDYISSWVWGGSYSTGNSASLFVWNTPPDDTPAAGVREPRKPKPGSPAIPAAAEPAYTGS